MIVPTVPASRLAQVETPPTPDQARTEADRILARPEYAEAQPNPIQRVIDWLFEQASELLGGIIGSSNPGSFFIGWIVLAAAVVAIGYVLWKVMPRSRLSRPDDEIRVERSRSVRTRRSEWLERAAAAEADGRFRESVHARYKATVAGLLERNELPDIDGNTGAEHLQSFDAADDRRRALADATGTWEDVWFGGAEASPDDSDRLAQLDEQVMVDRGGS